jgi:microcystin-dependent protein
MAKIIGRHTSGSAVGTIIPCGNASALPGTLLCDGSAVSRTTYADLFAAIGVAYGAGDGSTTFNLPDTRGIFLRGAGTQTIGGISYSGTIGTRQGDQMQGHIHNENANVSTGQNGIASGAILGLGNGGTGASGATSYNTGVPISDGTNGTPRTGSETRPANVGVNYCIAF